MTSSPVNTSSMKIVSVLAVGLGLLVVVLWSLGGGARWVTAAPVEHALPAAATVRYVKPGGTTGGRCSTPETACRTVQYAVDVASAGDEIRVATGIYTDLHPYIIDLSQTITQVVHIWKDVTIRGGYTPANWGTPSPADNPTVLDAQGRGRVIYIQRDIAPTIEGLWITGGAAAGLRGGPEGKRDVGGGVHAVRGSVVLRDNRVFSNSAAYGGGLYLAEGAATLSANIVTSNTAEQGGGLYLHDSAATLSGNTIGSNEADYGGGLFLSRSAAQLDDNFVSTNRGFVRGGGLLLWLSDEAVLNMNTVVSNTAGHGGGLYLDESPSTLNGNTIAANVAGEGGGLYFDRSAAMFINNVVADNEASTAGSGLYILASSPLLLHSTIARNASGDGRGIYVTDDGEYLSDVDLINTILVGHEVGISVTTSISLAAPNRATLEATLWGAGAWANSVDWSGAGLIVTGTRNYRGDPDFVAPDAGNFHIGVLSAALDRGVFAAVRDDMDGDPRPQGEGYDLGADETGLALSKHASPKLAAPGGQVHYTIRLTNTSDVRLTAAITDVLPEHVTPHGATTWGPVPIEPGQVHVETLVVTVDAGYTGWLTNVVEVTTDRGAGGTCVETSESGIFVHLPLVMRDG
jgi:uncharacterized repeat protein (TIGR01451 family)